MIKEGNSSNILLRITHNELSNNRLINSISKEKFEDEMIVVSSDKREGNAFKTVRLPVWQRRDNSGKRYDIIISSSSEWQMDIETDKAKEIEVSQLEWNN